MKASAEKRTSTCKSSAPDGSKQLWGARMTMTMDMALPVGYCHTCQLAVSIPTDALSHKQAGLGAESVGHCYRIFLYIYIFFFGILNCYYDLVMRIMMPTSTFQHRQFQFRFNNEFHEIFMR